MSTIPFFLISWVIHVIVAAVVVTPVVFLARKRVHWYVWDVLTVVVPFCVWMGLMFSDMSAGSKTLANLAIEPNILALTVALGALVRVGVSASMPQRTASILTLVALCFAAAGVFWIVPALSE